MPSEQWPEFQEAFDQWVHSILEKREDAYWMSFNKLAQRIWELDETVKLEMTERARLASRLERIEQWLSLEFDLTHDREGEQDAS